MLQGKSEMCGIAGILNFNNQPVSETQIRSMTDVIKHRDLMEREVGLTKMLAWVTGG